MKVCMSGTAAHLRPDDVPSQLIGELIRVKDRREGAEVVQLPGSQVAQVSQRCQVHVHLGGDEQVYADLHADSTLRQYRCM